MTIYILFTTLVAGFVSAIVLAAATLEPNDAQRNSPITSPAGTVAAESTGRQAAGEKLFQELGCIGCHRPDATGIGPALTSLFGRPVTDASCGALTVDEEFLREAILKIRRPRWPRASHP